jgi:glycyl-tRNA synthetase
MSPDQQRMEKIVSLCKRRGFIFQAGEIYGGLNGCWDYGPLGVELKRNVKDYWWRVMVRERDDVVGMDGSILTHRAVLRASGHEETFSDPMVECLVTNQRFRADQIAPQSGVVHSFDGAVEKDALPPDAWDGFDRARFGALEFLSLERNSERAEPFSVLAGPMRSAGSAKKTAIEFYKRRGLIDPIPYNERTSPVHDTRDFNPSNGSILTKPRPFNLMFATKMGASADPESIAYLRPETAQSIFVQFKNVLDTARKKLPFGIAQIGKAFRNEINPRNYIFRSREFEQMELEYFCRPEQGMELLEYWKEERIKFYENIGIPRDKLHVLTVPDADRAFYSKGTYDIEYDFPFGRQELEGVAYRTDYDLKQHQEASGKPLDYFDEETKQRFIPHVVEPSAGVDRTVLALLCNAYDEETVMDEKGKSETRIVMRFHPRIAPVKVGVFPLLKNNEQLVANAREVQAALRPHMNVFYDETGAIGRRYRRQDEAGTPFGITVDFETLGEKDAALLDTVTLRHRDSMKQERVKISELLGVLLPQTQ